MVLKNRILLIINNTKIEILKLIEDELNNIIKLGEEKEVYFHDIISECVDSNCPRDRTECLELINFTGNEKYADKGVLDFSSLDRSLITLAYECLHQEIFNDSFFQYLQDKLNGEVIKSRQAKEILNKIKEYKKENELGEFEPIDNDGQIYVNLKKKKNKNKMRIKQLKNVVRIIKKIDENHQIVIATDGKNKEIIVKWRALK